MVEEIGGDDGTWNKGSTELRLCSGVLLPHCVRCMPQSSFTLVMACGCCYTVAVEAAVSLAACVCVEVEVSLCEFAQ